MNLALNNVYCANTHPPSVILGLAHGSYGVGGIVAPIIGTAVASHGIIWSRFYFLLVGLRLCCIAFAAWSFWSFKEDSEDTLLEATTSRQTATEEAVSKLRNLKLALKNKVTIFGALFIFAYQGAEVSISGWFISYLINYRNGDPARVGYVTAGFWVSTFLSVATSCTNLHTGWYHTRPFCPDSRSAKDRREEFRRHPYTRHNRSSTTRLAHSKLDRKCSCGVPSRSFARSSLPVFADHLFAPHTSTHPNNNNWVHWRSRQLGWCSRSLHNRYSCASCRHLGPSSRMSWHVCSHAGLLGRIAQGAQAD